MVDLQILDEQEQEIFEIFMEEAENEFGPNLRMDEASGTCSWGILFSRVLSRTLDEVDE